MALINKIIKFSCIDGPGNRTAIFFQGCNFRCSFCHNPETINICNSCGSCVGSCLSGALELLDGKKVFWHEKKCKGCDECIKVCRNNSSPKVKDYSVEQLFGEIKKIEPFIEGITVSGGEATLNGNFLVELFKRVKSELGLSCFVDTNGGVDLTEKRELVEITDRFMLDVKSIDSKEHRTITGVGNEIVIKNLEYLLKLGKLHEVRTVIAPRMNNRKNVGEIGKIIGGRCHYKLNIYRRYGVREEGVAFHGEESLGIEEINFLENLKFGETYIKK